MKNTEVVLLMKDADASTLPVVTKSALHLGLWAMAAMTWAAAGGEQLSMEAGHLLFIGDADKDTTVVCTRIKTKLARRCDNLLDLLFCSTLTRAISARGAGVAVFMVISDSKGWLHLR
jgi:hypothetical protein